MERFNDICPKYTLNGELTPVEVDILFSETKVTVSWAEFLELERAVSEAVARVKAIPKCSCCEPLST